MNEEKFQAFKWYSAGDPLILGVIETVDHTATRKQVQLSKQPEILEFKQNKNIWITIEKQKVKKTAKSKLDYYLSLRDLIICEYKYKVMPHFILYPTLRPGEFFSLSGVSFNEVLNNSQHWDKEKPLIESNELSRLYDLTDNDIIIRQINCSQILERLLVNRVKESKNQTQGEGSVCTEKFDFDRDFYGEQGFWTKKNSWVMRIMALIFAIIYYPYNMIIDLFLYLQSFDWLNCIVMIKRKKHQMNQCSNYLKILKFEKPNDNQNMFDFHFYKIAIYSKFASLLTQMVLDIIFGILFLIYLHAQTTSALIVLHWIGQGL